MNIAFDPKLLDALSELVSDRSGLRFSPDRREDLERGVRAAARELGFSDPLECASSLVSSPLTSAQVRILASHLTIGETYFFREKASFQLLEERILPELIELRRGGAQRIRIWSAGCCTGEEPYSVAICLARLLPDPTGWDIAILGTDINEQFLEKAREAVYGEWSFRDTPSSIIERYFTRTHSGRRRLLPHLRRYCTFAPLNLGEDIYPSFLNGTHAIDVILCRNVLIYFDAEHGVRLVRNLGQALTEGGWLLVGAAEGSQVHCEDLAPALAPGTMAFRKRTATAGASMELPMPTVAAQTEDWFSATALPPEPLATHNPSTLPTMEAAAAQTPFVVAMASHEQGLYADVVAGLLPLCTAGHGDPLSLALLARAYANQGNRSQALEWCEKAISVDKVNPRLHYLRAAILQELGEAAEATASFRRAIYLDDEFIMAHVGAAHLAIRLGKRKDADQHLARAHQLLSRFGPDQTVPESEGLDAKHLAELIAAAWNKRNPR
jgi:chemotaxis protein methyltransferase CheR